jgi:biopolymer transport protein ExbD
MNFRTDRKVMTGIGMISLTDIVLLLLIFFLLSSTFILQPGIKVTLPRSTTHEASEEESVIITIRQDGSIFLNNMLVPNEKLAFELNKLLGEEADRMIVIQAHHTITIEQTVKVMDIVKSVGGRKFLIATQPEES